MNPASWYTATSSTSTQSAAVSWRYPPPRRDDEGGDPAGDREPRRPAPPSGSGSVYAVPAEATTA